MRTDAFDGEQKDRQSRIGHTNRYKWRCQRGEVHSGLFLRSGLIFAQVKVQWTGKKKLPVAVERTQKKVDSLSPSFCRFPSSLLLHHSPLVVVRPFAMTSRQDDNFDLYDDPYVASSGSGGADPYAEDDDDYYGSSHGGDRGRGGYDDNGKDERSRYQSNREGADSRGRDRLEESSAYDPQRGQQTPPNAQDASEGYDPAQPYHQQRDAPYQQQQQQHQQQHAQSYSRTSHQGPSQYGSEGGSYNQPPRPQQQAASTQSSSMGGREHG